MNDSTVLLRQINPSFVQSGRVTSQAFRPTPKDQKRLSVDNGDLISAEASFLQFQTNPNCRSAGVMAFTCGECGQLALEIDEDGVPYESHCSVKFDPFSNSEIEKKAKFLSHFAQQRGWLHEAERG